MSRTRQKLLSQEIIDDVVATSNSREEVARRLSSWVESLAALRSPEQGEAGQWISVKDRLPDNDRNVIVFTKYKYRGVGCLVAGYWYLSIAPETDQEEGVITHWQELPAPPTTEDPTTR